MAIVVCQDVIARNHAVERTASIHDSELLAACKIVLKTAIAGCFWDHLVNIECRDVLLLVRKKIIRVARCCGAAALKRVGDKFVFTKKPAVQGGGYDFVVRFLPQVNATLVKDPHLFFARPILLEVAV